MYSDELGREVTPEEIVLGTVLAVVTFVVVWKFLNWATD